MGFTAEFTAYSADPDRNQTVRGKDASRIVGVHTKASGMAAGAGELVELEAIDNRIVIILRKVIVIFDKNDYHSLALLTQLETVVSGKRAAFVLVGFGLSFFIWNK